MPRTHKSTINSIVICLSLITLIGIFPISTPLTQKPLMVKTASSTTFNSLDRLLASKSQFPIQESSLFVKPSNPIPIPDNSSLLSLGNVQVVYGEYVNESTQEPVTIWTDLFQNLGFNVTASHIDAFNHSPSLI